MSSRTSSDQAVADPGVERTHFPRPDQTIDVLMYHSISTASGPTSIAPDLFCAQMEALAVCGCKIVALDTLVDWLARKVELPAHAVAITFDDGFDDFAEHAFPELERRGWPATVFIPTGKMGGVEEWDGANSPPRRLLDWAQIAELAGRGVAFGGHSVTHPDLTRLSDEQLEREVRQSREEIERRIGRTPVSFAAPYGRAGHRERKHISHWYRLGVSTTLRQANRMSDPHDIPRIEMHYFRDLVRWRGYLQHREKWYFETRRALRSVRQALAWT